MNQLELNRIAELFVQKQSIEVAKKLDSILIEDLKERAEQMPGSAVHHIHNVALFDSLLRINSLFQIKNRSEAASREYLEHAETLKPKFLDIVNSLKDFEPVCEGDEGNDPTNR